MKYKHHKSPFPLSTVKWEFGFVKLRDVKSNNEMYSLTWNVFDNASPKSLCSILHSQIELLLLIIVHMHTHAIKWHDCHFIHWDIAKYVILTLSLIVTSTFVPNVSHLFGESYWTFPSRFLKPWYTIMILVVSTLTLMTTF